MVDDHQVAKTTKPIGVNDGAACHGLHRGAFIGAQQDSSPDASLGAIRTEARHHGAPQRPAQPGFEPIAGRRGRDRVAGRLRLLARNIRRPCLAGRLGSGLARLRRLLLGQSRVLLCL